MEPRATCARCWRPAAFCWCPHLTTIETKTRVVLLLHPPGREPVAVDQTRIFADWQKDQLLLDTEITIRYNPADPEEFEIVWGPREPPRPTSTSVYGPRQ